MSIIKTFLTRSAVTVGLVAMTLTTIQTTKAEAQVNSRVNGNNNNGVINNRGGGRGGHYRGRRGGGNGGAILAGVVGGALLATALSSSSSRRYNDHYYDRPRYRSRVDVHYSYGNPGYGYRRYSRDRYYAPRTRVVYVERPVETVVREVPVYEQPRQRYYNQQPARYNQQPAQNSSCLQTREYQTTIEVGGQVVPAYGQACLQPDGSWKHGSPVAAPSF